MILQQTLYRVQQFWRALADTPAAADLDEARRILSEEQMALFMRLQPSEQAHSLRVFQRLQSAIPDEASLESRSLLIAALLHDVGKTCHPLNIIERVMVVLGKAAFPSMVSRWGQEQPARRSNDHQTAISYGWRRAFVVAQQHPEWGACLAAETGVSPLAVNLIRRHQNLIGDKTVSSEEQMLQLLQRVDQKS